MTWHFWDELARLIQWLWATTEGNMTFTVGDRILVRSVFTGPTGAVDVGALPITWESPGGKAIPDPTVFNKDGVSTVGYMIFIAVKAGNEVELRFKDIAGHGHHGALIDINPLPTITAQAAVVEGTVDHALTSISLTLKNLTSGAVAVAA